MSNIFEYLNQYLLFRNFIEVIAGLDNTLLTFNYLFANWLCPLLNFCLR